MNELANNLGLFFAGLKIFLYIGIAIFLFVLWSFIVYTTSKFWHSAKEDEQKRTFLKMSKEILNEKEKENAKRPEK